MQTASLDHLKPGDSATIRAIDAEEGLYQRFTALGFRIGKQIELVRQARFRGPLHVRLGTTDVMLRRADARRVQVSLEPAATIR
jgi:ferrous iron transport protein A